MNGLERAKMTRRNCFARWVIALGAMAACVATSQMRWTTANAQNFGLRPVADQDIAALFQQVEASLMNNRLPTLEEQAKAFRNPDVRFPAGYPKLYYFYAALGAFAGSNCTCGTAVPAADKKAALQAWLNAMPTSITAKIAMAKFLTFQAFKIRGGAYASQTPAKQLAMFQENMAQAYKYLSELEPKQDPAIYGGLFSVTRALGKSRALMDANYKAAVESFPTYFFYYMSRADLLQPRWFGVEGEEAAYLEGLAHSNNGDAGLVAYSFAAEKLLETNRASDLYTDLGVNWQILKQSFRARAQRYGSSNKLRNLELRLAVVADDREYAASLVKIIAGAWDLSVWRDATSFADASSWATQPPITPNP